MRNEIAYEWSLEITEDGDIIDSDFSPVLNFKDIPANGCLVLVRNVGNEIEGLTDRSWAYVFNGILPTNFTDAGGGAIAKVPAKYKKELAAFLGNVREQH